MANCLGLGGTNSCHNKRRFDMLMIAPVFLKLVGPVFLIVVCLLIAVVLAIVVHPGCWILVLVVVGQIIHGGYRITKITDEEEE